MQHLLIVLFAVLALPAAAHDFNLHRLPLADAWPQGRLDLGCHTNPNGRGAWRDGPWINKRHGTFDVTAKIAC